MHVAVTAACILHNASAVHSRAKLLCIQAPLLKRPAGMKKPAAAPKKMLTKKKMLKKKPQWMPREKPKGCGKCRNIPGCTPSCWKYRGRL